MFSKTTRSGYGLHIQRKKTTQAAVVVIAVVLLAAVPALFFTRAKGKAGGDKRELLQFWEAGAFDQAFNASKAALVEQPMDYFLLTLHGFAAYQLGISQINSANTTAFIDQCVWALRKALLLKQSAADGRVYYVLGKAYTYKGDMYADLAVKYLEKAGDLSYDAPDIPEYLGLAYAAIGDYRSSVEAFSRALTIPEEAMALQETMAPQETTVAPDALLLAIARSYIALEEPEQARPYLQRCVESSSDSKIRVQARLLLGTVLDEMGEIDAAENQYMIIFNEAGENAEAHYQLGELYARRGNIIKARSEWRLANKADPAHGKARARLKEQGLLS